MSADAKDQIIAALTIEIAKFAPADADQRPPQTTILAVPLTAQPAGDRQRATRRSVARRSGGIFRAATHAGAETCRIRNCCRRLRSHAAGAADDVPVPRHEHARRRGAVRPAGTRHFANGPGRRGPSGGTSLRFLRRGDDRGEIELALLRRGQSRRFGLPPRLCAGVAGSRVEIQIVRAARRTTQVVGHARALRAALLANDSRGAWQRRAAWTRLTPSSSNWSRASRACSRTIRRPSLITAPRPIWSATSELAVIDPGPGSARAYRRYGRGDRRPAGRAIMCTHTHRDHSPAARPLAERIGAPIIGCAPLALETVGPRADAAFDGDYPADRVLADGETVEIDGRASPPSRRPATRRTICASRMKARCSPATMSWAGRRRSCSRPTATWRAYMASLDKLRQRDDRDLLSGARPAGDQPAAICPRADGPPDAARAADPEAGRRAGARHPRHRRQCLSRARPAAGHCGRRVGLRPSCWTSSGADSLSAKESHGPPPEQAARPSPAIIVALVLGVAARGRRPGSPTGFSAGRTRGPSPAPASNRCARRTG